MDEVSRFALLASAVCGRPLQVTATGPGEPAWTDGTTVFVDEAVPDPIAAVTVQAALIAAGSLQPDVLAVLRRRPALVPRYLAVEGQRALLSSERLLPAAVRVTLDRELAARSDSPAHSLQLASSGAVAGHLPSFFGTIRPRHVHAGEPGAPDHGAPAHRHVSRRAATAALRALDDGEEEGAVADFTSPVEGGGGIGRLLKRLFGDARTTGGGPPGADAPTHLPRRAAPSRRSTAFSSARPPAPDAPPPAQRPGYRYPEWDRHRRSYRLDWCTVIESEPEPSELQPFEIRADVAMRRALGRLGTGFERRRRQVDGDDLDVDAVVEARAEVVAGTTPNDGLFIDSVRRRRDLAVLVLLDVSASAGELGVLGVPVHEHQRRAAAALVSALHGLGDRVALYAFRSQGRAAVHVVTVKRFGDELDELVRERLGGLVPGAYTRLGAAIRHGGAVLERQGGTTRRLLVVLSDGFAYDHGYERAYGEADARRALSEVRRAGTGCLCLSVGAAADVAALRRVFGTAAHASVPRVAQLPAIVGSLFRAALGSADVARRVHVRRTRAHERLDVERRSA